MERSIEIGSGFKERDIGFLRGIFMAGGAFLLGCTKLFGAPAPFAAAFSAGMRGLECVFAFVGAVIGYTLSGSFEQSIPYIAAMGALTALRLILGNRNGRITRAVISAATAVCVLLANAFSAEKISDIMLACGFGIIAGGAAFAFDSVRVFSDKPALLSGQPFFPVVCGILYTLLTAAFASLSVGIFNLGAVIAAVGILYSADYRREMPAIIGILSAAGLAIGNGGFSTAAIILALGSLAVTFLGRYSRLTRSCGLFFAVGFGMLLTGINEYTAVCSAAALIAGAAYVLIPERYIPVYRNRCPAAVATAAAPFSAFGQKLESMGEAVGEMNKAIERTAKALDKQNVHDISRIYQNAGEQVCRSCKNNMQCWGSYYNTTSDILGKAVSSIRSGVLADETMLGGHFERLCPNRRELSQALNRQYAAFCAAEAASRKVGEMRGVLSAQLNSTRKMLCAMSEELSAERFYDTNAAGTAEQVLKENGVKNPSVLAICGAEGILTLDIYGTGLPYCDPEELSTRLAFALGKEFDPPMIQEYGEKVHICVSERSLYDAQIRIFQKNKSENRQNGDCCDCFNDGKGSVYMILSDGMGSGSRARIDSAFACSMLSRMLRAGIDFDASVEMLNTSLLVKSSDESFATLDVCCINLYTGKISLYKAGSAETFVRCGKSFAKLDGSGLPLGAGIPASFTEKSFTVAAGDVIIMVSDGADIDETWLEQLIMRERSADLDRIIDTIGEALRLSARKGEEDDVTVIGVKVVK